PVWFSLEIILTNAVNFVSFELQFSSVTNASGLLTVYWNTNEVGMIDERFALPGFQRYTLEVTTTPTGVLGFRLDTFVNEHSSAAITNINLGFAGFRDPLTLGAAINETNAT